MLTIPTKQQKMWWMYSTLLWAGGWYDFTLKMKSFERLLQKSTMKYDIVIIAVNVSGNSPLRHRNAAKLLIIPWIMLNLYAVAISFDPGGISNTITQTIDQNKNACIAQRSKLSSIFVVVKNPHWSNNVQKYLLGDIL